MNKTYCITFWKRWTDGTEAVRCYDVVRASSLKDAKRQFSERCKTSVLEHTLQARHVSVKTPVDDGKAVKKTVAELRRWARRHGWEVSQ